MNGKVVRITALCSLLFLASGFIYAEDEAFSEEQLVLPDVTTVVSGDSLSAGKEAIPDFSSVLVETSDNQGVVPMLPGVEIYDVPEEPVADLSFVKDTSVYSEGLIGGGYPGYFIGDFSIYQSSGTEPFLLRFSQLTENGYGRHSASEGYFDSNTLLLGSKVLKAGPFEFNLQCSYSTANYGLQGQSLAFYDITRQNIDTTDSAKWILPYGFNVALGTQLAWYSRYSGIKDSGISFTSQEELASVLYTSPKISAGWSNRFVDLAVNAEYTLEAFAEKMDTETAGTSVINRGKFDFNFAWNYNAYSVKANAGVIVGSAIGTALPVLPPFAVEFNGEWELPYAPTSLKVTAAGGLDSYLPLYPQLEENYLYATQYYLPEETSDWYGKLSVSVPVLSMFTVDTDFDFKKTAFGNGVWEATYGTPSANGVYTYQQIDRTLFDSVLAASFNYDIYNVKMDWASHWIHVPSNENKFSLGLSASVQAQQWGADLSIRESLGKGADYVPVINIGGFYRLRDSLRLAVEVKDTVKLLTGDDRTYFNSIYSQRAGSATLLIKFFF